MKSTSWFGIFTGCVLIDTLVWAVARSWWLDSLQTPKDLWDAQVSLWQALFVVNGFVGLVIQSHVALDQLGLTKAQWQTEQLKNLRSEINDLKERKPIVLARESAPQSGQYEIVNVGNSLAVNVWSISKEGYECLGALAPTESRRLVEPASRYLLIAETRPYTSRKFTRTMNVRMSNGEVCHGFLNPERDENLSMEGALEDYLQAESRLFDRFMAWQPGKPEPK